VTLSDIIGVKVTLK